MSRYPKELTVEVEGAPDVPGEGKPRRSYFAKDKLVENTETKNLFENLKKGVERARDKPCIGRRPFVNGVAQPYVWITYEQFFQRVLNVGSGLKHRGLEKGSTIGIFAINRTEWLITEQGANGFGVITVPLYDTLGAEAIEYIINQVELKIIFASNDKLSSILKDISKYPTLKTLVLFDGATAEEKEKGKSANIEVLSFEEFETEGQQNKAEPTPGGPDDIVTIMYTSGTTGLPKGAMISSKNILSDAAGIDYYGVRNLCFKIDKDDVHLSYLPLAHIFERMIVTYCLGVGAAVGMYQGNALKLLEDIDQLKPTFFPSVPRLLNRIYDKIIAAVEVKGGVSSVLFNMAVDSKKSGLRDGYLTHWLWDRLVFSNVKARLGGRVRTIITASAPIAPQVLDFLRLAFCCEVHEAYGQTESTGGSTVSLAGDYESGHVGIPLPCNEIKLVDIPEMNYTSKDKPFPRGEVCFRGPNVFVGYYKAEDKTKEAIDENGWLHSGDIGLWDERGRLRIIDRKKNIFKLAQGEYIAPEKIENVYTKSKYVAQAFVYGDSLKAFLVAILVPDEEVLVPWAQSQGITGPFADIIKTPKVKELILQDILKTGKDLGLKSFEQVKDIYLDSKLFSVENNLLTPTFKLKRPQAKEFYQEKIDELIAAVQKIEEEKEKKQYLAEEQKKN